MFFRFLSTTGSPTALVGHDAASAKTVANDVTVQGGHWEAHGVKHFAAIPSGTRFVDVGIQAQADTVSGKDDELFLDDVLVRVGKPRLEPTVGVFQRSTALNIGRGMERRVTL